MNDVVVTPIRIAIPIGVIDGTAMVTHLATGPTDFSRMNCARVSLEAFIVYLPHNISEDTVFISH